MTTVVGVGNDWRGDDGAGLAVVRGLRAAGIHGLEQDGEPVSLLNAWAGAPEVIVVDAVRTGAPPGTIHRMDPTALPAGLRLGSTHALGIPEAVELARSLGRLPRRLELYGIEGECFETGAGLTPAVALAVDELSAELRERLATVSRPR